MSIDRQIDKENIVYTYNGILFSLKKGDPIICANMIGFGRYAKWNMAVIEGHILHDFTYMR